jgi:hypothetical protein
MLEIFGMQDCKPVKTPASFLFNQDSSLLEESLNEDEAQFYQKMIGSLMYAMTGSRIGRILEGCLKAPQTSFG